MLPDWPSLFNSRPLHERAVELSLPGQTAPVWFASACRADLQELPPELFLAEAEIARAAMFKFDQPRENFALGRLAGKLALERGLVCPPPAVAKEGDRIPIQPALGEALRQIGIGNGERGEPVVRVRDGDSSALGVSLSHVNGSGVAVAFPAAVRVGLDLERIDPKRAATVRRGVPLSPEEEHWLQRTTLPEATALLVLWTAREALGKALGIGLACKWESLALQEIYPVGTAQFCGSFRHHAAFRCASWVGIDAVLSLAFEAGGGDVIVITPRP